MSHPHIHNRPLRNGFRDPPRGTPPGQSPGQVPAQSPGQVPAQSPVQAPVPVQAPAADLALATVPAPPRQRRGGWTVEKQQLFLRTLALTGSVEAAAASVGLSVRTAYNLRNHPGAENFRAGWATAIAACVVRARDVAFDRAFNGQTVPLMRNGEVRGSRTVFNDKLLMFLLAKYDWNVTGFGATGFEDRFSGQLEALVDLPMPPADIIVGEADESSVLA